MGAAEIQDAAAKNQSPSHRRAVRESGSVEENVNAAGSATAEESATAEGNVSRSAIVRAAAIPGLNPASSRDRFPIPDADAMTNSVYG
ncbi:MAG: hypothetical protein HFI60_12950 [Lachnospiraceae bacterium]|nr:hypothetical protein [Lachnospiraceae bacterium]